MLAKYGALGASCTALMMLFLSGCSDANSSDNSTSASSTSSIGVATASAAAVTQLTITGTPSLKVTADNPYSFDAYASGGNGATLAFSIQNKPSWATFNTSTGELKGTPHVAGVYGDIKISVSDGASSASLATFAITVSSATVASTSPGSATLSWAAPQKNTDGTLALDLTGYAVYYGTTTSNMKRVSVSASAHSYAMTNLTKGVTYYFAVAAVNSLNNESELSEVVSTAI